MGRDTISVPADMVVGLAVTSHQDGAIAHATFDQVALTTDSLPDDWTTSDVGQTGPGGSATASAGTFTVKGAGADV